MASVLAIAPSTIPADSLDRLEHELKGHQITRLTSAAEAVASINRAVPDLVVFPLAVARDEMQPVVARLRQISGADAAQWRLFDAITEDGSPEDSRWFYWFKPQAVPAPEPEPSVAERVRSSAERAAGIVEWLKTAVGHAADAAGNLRDPLVEWAPRLAIVGAIAVAGITARAFWPSIKPMLTADKPADRQQVEVKRVPPAEERPLTAARKTGALEITSDPPGATVVLGGKERGVTPLTIDSLPAGTHQVLLRSEAGTVRHSVVVKANETTTWEATIYSGWVAVFSPFELQVTEAGKMVRLDEQSQAMLPPGRHELRLTNAALGFSETRTVDIQPGEVTNISISARKTTLTVLGTPGAAASVDGTPVGETPLLDVPVDVGTREVLLRHPNYGERRITVTATASPVRINVDLSQP